MIKIIKYLLLMIIAILILSYFTPFAMLLLPFTLIYYKKANYNNVLKKWNNGVCEKNNIKWRMSDFNEIAEHSSIYFFEAGEEKLSINKKIYKKICSQK